MVMYILLTSSFKPMYKGSIVLTNAVYIYK